MQIIKNKIKHWFAFLGISILFILNTMNVSDVYSQELISDSVFVDTIFVDTMPINPGFLPVIFTGKVLPKNYLTGGKELDLKLTTPNILSENIIKTDQQESFLAQYQRTKKVRNNAYLYLTKWHPELIRYHITSLPNNDISGQQMAADPRKEMFNVEFFPDYTQSGSPTVFKIRKHWSFYGNNLIQFSQNYISDNWSSGGIGNLNILSNQNFTATYEKNKTRFNSYTEWNLSLFTTPKDTLRRARIGTDLFRTYNEFGLRIGNNKHWSFSTNLELKTQFFNNYQENTQTMVSAFVSPLLANWGVAGFRYDLDKKYKHDRYQNLKISADISLFSAKLTYVGNDKVDPTRFGIPKGDNSMLKFGTSINSTLYYKFNRTTYFKTRFKFFTGFSSTEIESENELNVGISRFFSTRIYLYVKFDDSGNVPKDPTFGLVQINELFSFGFNYKW